MPDIFYLFGSMVCVVKYESADRGAVRGNRSYYGLLRVENLSVFHKPLQVCGCKNHRDLSFGAGTDFNA